LAQVCSSSRQQLWPSLSGSAPSDGCRRRRLGPVPAPCRFGARCWRPGCSFHHPEGEDRQQILAELARFWNAETKDKSECQGGRVEFAAERVVHDGKEKEGVAPRIGRKGPDGDEEQPRAEVLEEPSHFRDEDEGKGGHFEVTVERVIHEVVGEKKVIGKYSAGERGHDQAKAKKSRSPKVTHEVNVLEGVAPQVCQKDGDEEQPIGQVSEGYALVWEDKDKSVIGTGSACVRGQDHAKQAKKVERIAQPVVQPMTGWPPGLAAAQRAGSADERERGRLSAVVEREDILQRRVATDEAAPVRPGEQPGFETGRNKGEPRWYGNTDEEELEYLSQCVRREDWAGRRAEHKAVKRRAALLQKRVAADEAGFRG